MLFFYSFHFHRKRRAYFIICLCIIILIFAATSIWKKDATETALIKGNKHEKTIALTFNISWGEEKVFSILDVLKKHKVRASFFVSGEWAERHPQIVEAITENEHELGMLGYRYKNYLELDVNQVRKDILYARQVFKKLGYEDIRYIRPPSGLFNKEIITLAESLGLEVIHWSINSEDWKSPGVAEIKKKMSKSSNGDIILLHASDSAKQTAEVLDDFIPNMHKKGFSYTTISALKNNMTSEEKLIE